LFKIETKGFFRRRRRVTSRDRLAAADFRAIAARLGLQPVRARKVGYVSARQARAPEPIETHWNGKESKDVAHSGDWIVTNMSADREILRDASGHANTYVIRAAKFPTLYVRDEGSTPFGTIYKSKSRVEAIHLSGGFEIMAPWDEIQRAPDGYLLLSGSEVYGNNRETFEATYEVVS
jgi:hypothetical protein